MDLNALRERHAIPGLVDVIAGQGGLAAVSVTTPAASAQVYLHGAHVTHFAPAGERPVLFVSRQSFYADGKAIRGGVPVIFPWFGPHPANPSQLPAHGLVRARAWELAATEGKADGSVVVRLRLASDERTHRLWPHDFELSYAVSVGPKLRLELTVRNTGAAPFRFEEALHTYLAVADIRDVKIGGLGGRTYIDKTDHAARKTQVGTPFGIAGETDRVYLDTRDTVTVTDPAGSAAGGKRVVTVAKENSAATVIWNPWIAKAAAFADFGDDEWPNMLCVESANAAQNAVMLPAGQTHVMATTIGLG